VQPLDTPELIDVVPDAESCVDSGSSPDRGLDESCVLPKAEAAGEVSPVEVAGGVILRNRIAEKPNPRRALLAGEVPEGSCLCHVRPNAGGRHWLVVDVVRDAVASPGRIHDVRLRVVVGKTPERCLILELCGCRDWQSAKARPLACLPAEIAAPVEKVWVPRLHKRLTQAGGIVQRNPTGLVGNACNDPSPPLQGGVRQLPLLIALWGCAIFPIKISTHWQHLHRLALATRCGDARLEQLQLGRMRNAVSCCRGPPHRYDLSWSALFPGRRRRS
jgi:hypothetical protein